MINPSELRIGNYVLVNMDKIRVINEINSVYVETSFRGGLLNYEKYDDIYGIDLVPEILTKCGFEKMTIGWWVKYPVSLYWDKVGYMFSDIPSLQTKFKHLHQLQNLYFALTGEELQINL